MKSNAYCLHASELLLSITIIRVERQTSSVKRLGPGASLGVQWKTLHFHCRERGFDPWLVN